jgi:hypothetical protein
MFRQISKFFGGGIGGLFIALIISILLIIGIIGFVGLVIIFLPFFLFLIIGCGFSSWFYKVLKQKYKMQIPRYKDFFTWTIGDFIDAFQWRDTEPMSFKEQCRMKEKEANEKIIRLKRGMRSLEDTWKSLIDKDTIKKSITKKRTFTSSRLKAAALTTFETPSFTRLTDEIEKETVRFEDFLI